MFHRWGNREVVVCAGTHSLLQMELALGPNLLEGKGLDTLTFCIPHNPAPQSIVCRRFSANTNSLNYLNQYLPIHPEIIPWDVICVYILVVAKRECGLGLWRALGPSTHLPYWPAAGHLPLTTLFHTQRMPRFGARTGLTDWPNPLHFIDGPIYKSRSKSVPSFMNSPLVLSCRKSSYTTGDQSRSIYSWAHAWKDL